MILDDDPLMIDNIEQGRASRKEKRQLILPLLRNPQISSCLFSFVLLMACVSVFLFADQGVPSQEVTPFTIPRRLQTSNYNSGSRKKLHTIALFNEPNCGISDLNTAITGAKVMFFDLHACRQV